MITSTNFAIDLFSASDGAVPREVRPVVLSMEVLSLSQGVDREGPLFRGGIGQIVVALPIADP